jgi:NAD(P)-dependent dehydrogenase (short-subunit alcohol dehydrogenase family)
MKIDLKGRVAVVSGSTGGIGFAVARGLAEAGADVVLNGRKQEALNRAVAAVREVGPAGNVHGAVADLSTAVGCDALIQAAPRCDILVNNLGIYQLQDFFEIPDTEWTRFFETNIMSGVRLSRAYMPEMMARTWGRVVFISSESALNIPPDMIHYGFTKTAVLGIARGLAKRAAGTGVTVNAVLPGPTLSDGVKAMLKETAEKTGKSIEQAAVDFVKANRPSSIIQRAARPEEVANMVIYAVSPQASATTGAALRVDGGVVDTIT